MKLVTHLNVKYQVTHLKVKYQVTQRLSIRLLIKHPHALAPITLHHNLTVTLYWAIQAGLLTHLTFAQHHLSPLAAFTSGAYFLHNGRR